MLDVRIAKPCDQAWNAMEGDERVRHCGLCRKNVYNLASLTEAEVATLIREKEGRFCARVYRRVDGRVLTADCPGVVTRRRRMRVSVALGLAVSLVNAGCMGSTGSSATQEGSFEKGTASTPRTHPEKSEVTPSPQEGRSLEPDRSRLG